MWVWALSKKEFRQLIGMVAVAVVLLYGFMLQLDNDIIPFLNEAINYYLPLLAGGLALVMGFWQTLSEHQRGTWLYLLHRPVSRKQIMLVKMGVGLLMTWLAVGVPMLFYARWLSRPGNFPAPFHWEMTIPFWKNLLAISTLYLAAYLSGLRKARWLGSRLFPVLFALIFTFYVMMYIPFFKLYLAIGIVNAFFVWAILQQCEQEEYA